MKDNRLFKRLVVTGTIAWIILFGVIPTLMLTGVSFLTRDPDDLISPVFSVESYARLLDPHLGSMLLDSFFMAGMATLICLLVGYRITSYNVCYTKLLRGRSSWRKRVGGSGHRHRG